MLLVRSHCAVLNIVSQFHPYEGHHLSSVVYPIRVMAKLGVKDVISMSFPCKSVHALTIFQLPMRQDHLIQPSLWAPVNPLNLRVYLVIVNHLLPVVVIQDHLALPNLTGMNPLLGPHTDPELPRFLPLSDAYSPVLRRLLFLAAHRLQLEDSALAEGTYAWVSGPTYESPAEGRFLRRVGADVVGMSTVPEVLAAREEGLNVMVLSLVTNFVVIPETYRSIKEEVQAEVCASNDKPSKTLIPFQLAGKKVEQPVAETVSHEEVLAIGTEKAGVLMKLVENVVNSL